MYRYTAVAATLLLFCLILSRVLILRRHGTRAVVFGETNRTDYILPPFMLLLFYLLLAHAFDWPRFGGDYWFDVPWLGWLGLLLHVLALAIVAYALICFATSFRIGIDEKAPDELITSGAFAFSRNPIYVGFLLWLLGNFLVFPNWAFAAYFVIPAAAIHRQILREEKFCSAHYGDAYAAYCRKVRRYL